MKQRLSSLDVKVIAHELASAICTLRLSNVYDLSSRIFLLKFAKPGHRQQLVIDSGFRCHLSSFARSAAAEPSAFVARLRKFLKTRRVTGVNQIGTDRVIELQFSEGQYRLFLEFYAGGNIVLTDKDLKVIALLRIVHAGEEQEELRVGLRYSVENRQNYAGIPPLTKDRVRKGLGSAIAKDAANTAAGKKQRKKSSAVLRKALAIYLPEFPPMLLDHALKSRAFDASTSLQDILKHEEKLESLMGVLLEAQKVIEDVLTGPVCRGYIVAKPLKKLAHDVQSKGSEDLEIDKENETLIYEDFHPFRPRQFEDEPDVRILEYEGFNATVDEFFSSIESQRLESRLNEKEEAAKRKLQQAKDDHARRLGGLQQVQEMNVRKAQAIESNTQRVEEATAAINGLISQGMDWVEIARLIEMEQGRQNPVAEMIKLPLKLYENTATLLLAEETFDEVDDDDDINDETDSEVSDSDDEENKPANKSGTKPEDKRLDVDIDLGLSAWSNARQYYEQKKSAAAKERKTIQASVMALKSTEQKIQADLKKGLKQEKQQLRPVRKQLWFEKFFYFISSEGYLVVGGRDAQQNEILYKKYLNKGDCWVNADLSGASCLVVKNRSGFSDSPIPISTLSQAGSFCVSTSSAWDSKAMMAAWWVDCEQVSKTAPQGDYLGLGMFHIKGKKNFLPPAQLLLGFGVMFRISDESKKKHTKHRVSDDRVTESTSAHSDAEVPHTSDAEDQTNLSEEETVVNEDDRAAEVAETAEADTSSESGKEDGADEDDDHDDQDDQPQYRNPLQSMLQDSEATTKFKDLSIEDSRAQGEDEDEDEESDVDEDKSKSKETPSLSEPVSRTATPSTETSQIGSGTPNKNAPHVRGKKGKRSKIKSKYADQDEEDRALAMQLLGSATGQQKAKVEAELKAKKEAEAVAQKERRRQQHQAAQSSGKEAEEERRKKLDKNIPTMEKEELDELALVENFVGAPLPGDDVLDCLVVCGPWDSMGAKLMWRVKIQPGAQKKGKAVKEILGGWDKLLTDRLKKKMPAKDAPGYGGEVTIRKQAELVKNIRDAEVIGCVPVSKVRVEMKGTGGGDKGKGGKGKGGGAKSGGGKKGGRGGKKK